MIKQTGTGRAIRDNTGGLTLTVTNNAGALFQAADADAIQMNRSNSSISFDNYGSVISLNPPAAARRRSIGTQSPPAPTRCITIPRALSKPSKRMASAPE